jgi:serine/threonine-protein kinase
VSDRLPVLVADLADAAARRFLNEVAHSRGEAWVPLLAAPADASRHILEVYTPGGVEPLRVYADPLGAPGKDGFPLRLTPLGDDTVAELRRESSHEKAAAAAPIGDDDDQEETWTAAKPPVAAPHRDTPTAAFERKPAGPARREVEVTVTPAHAADLGGAPAALPSSPPPDPLIGRKLAGGKLQIDAFVGQGVMGAVYRAIHRELRIPIAVKVLHEDLQKNVDFCRRFYAEGLALSRLDHPNLVRVHDFGQELDGLLYLAMDFVDGRSLRDVVQKEAPLKLLRVAEIMAQICAGLAHAHAKGIVHRDVKPDNVVIMPGTDDDNNVVEVMKVCDFGLAIVSSKEALRERFAGSPIYMSPEQCRGEELDARTDIYSCGVMLYELATGTVPFLSDKPIVVVNRHLSMPPPPLAVQVPDADPRLERIVQRALTKNRGERYQDVREMRADLKEIVASFEPKRFDLAAEAARIEAELPPPSGIHSMPPSSRPMPSMPPMPSVSLPPPSPESQRRIELSRAETMPRDLARADTMPRSDSFTREESPTRGEVRVRQSPPPPKPESKKPDWLEEKGEGYDKFLSGMASGTHKSEELAETLAREPGPWLRRLATERDVKAFQKMLSELEVALRLLARRADSRALSTVSSALHVLATTGTQGAGTRGQRAMLLLRLFADPGLLAPIAERLLMQDDDARDAGRTLVTGAGVSGAYALYGARVKLAPHQHVRHPFVTTMRDIREAAWPVIRAALERIPDAALTGGHPLASDLAEDLLLCVPAWRDEAAGHLVVKFVRAREPGLCRAATGALTRVWADRAQPVLFGLLDDADDGVRIAAIAGLRDLGAIDEHVVRRLAPLVARGGASHELRLAAVSALEVATLDARRLASPMLVELVQDPAPDDATVLAAARALVTIVPDGVARNVVLDRAERSSEPLRSHLRALAT